MILTQVEQLEWLVQELKNQPEFSVDTENRGEWPLDPRRNDLFWFSFAWQGNAVAVPMGHSLGKMLRPPGFKERYKVWNETTGRWNTKVRTLPAKYAAPPPQLERDRVLDALYPVFFSDRLKSGHNIKYDVETVSKYYDEIIPGPYDDTMVMAFLLNENHRGKDPYSLGTVVKRYLKVDFKQPIGKAPDTHPFKVTGDYARRDAKYQWLLKQFLRPRITEDNLDGLYALEMDVLDVLVHMETTGAMIDLEMCHRVFDDLTVRIDELRSKIQAEVGHEFNLNSTPQKQKVFYEERGHKPRKFTDTGQPSTDADSLEYYRNDPVIAAFLDYQEANRLRMYPQTYLYGNPKRKTPPAQVNGRIHANFKQSGTVTGRFSCSDPNLQNIPRPESENAKVVRSLFIAPEGHKLIVGDYAQIEYAVLAHYSGDPTLIKFFEEGRNFHRAVASMLLGKPEEEVTKVEYTIVKNTNFATVYGAGDDKVAAMSGVSLSQAKRFRKEHARMLPKVYRFTEEVVRVCKNRRPPHVKTILGRKRRLPEIYSRDWKVSAYAERQAVNTVIQGSAADINKLAMVRTHRLLPDDMQLILTVHDELVVVCPTKKADEGVRLLTEAMEGIDLLRVPLRADIHAVDRWSEAKE